MRTLTPFRYFKTSPEIIRLAVMMYIRFPLSLRNVEDLLHERGIDISHETVRFWWNRFGPMFAAEIRQRRWSCPLKLVRTEREILGTFLAREGVYQCRRNDFPMSRSLLR
jgi:hypothetical protein